MKFEFEVSDPELLSSGLSHVLVSYGKVVSAAFFGCEIPREFEDYFRKYNINELDEKHEHLKKKMECRKGYFRSIGQANKMKLLTEVIKCMWLVNTKLIV